MGAVAHHRWRGRSAGSASVWALRKSARRTMNRLIGADDTPLARSLQYAVGARELAAGAGILIRRRPVRWLCARVIGDAMDLTLLGATLSFNRKERHRTAVAIASVVGVSVLDLTESLRLSRRPETTEEDSHMHGTTAITVRRPIDEVYRFWHDFENLPRLMSHL
jgi:uncharacterized membrane protein